MINKVLTFNVLPFYSAADWQVCVGTNMLNTIITYMGFWLWKHHYFTITYENNWMIVIDLLLLFFTMDLLMYLFHFAIHKTILYKWVHQLHHQSIDPTPIDLFVLHPIETIGFGSLWLMVLLGYNFNVYAVVLYLMVNLLFGMVGHLGVEPFVRLSVNNVFTKYLGTSTFHHNHHTTIDVNFGFYTTIWDRIFGTLKK